MKSIGLKKVVASIFVVIFSICTIFMYNVIAASDTLDDDTIITLIKSAMGDFMDSCDKLNMYFDDEGNLRMDISIPGADKSKLLSNKSQLADSWSSVKDSMKGISDSGHELLITMGRDDALFIINILDNGYDIESDLFFSTVNGKTVYTCY